MSKRFFKSSYKAAKLTIVSRADAAGSDGQVSEDNEYEDIAAETYDDGSGFVVDDDEPLVFEDDELDIDEKDDDENIPK